MTDIEALLAGEEADRAWKRVLSWARKRYGRDASVESLLFLIGIHASDGDFEVRLTKERKQELIMEGTYAVLATLDIYRREEDGWRRIRKLPAISESDQERLLQIAIARYLTESLELN